MIDQRKAVKKVLQDALNVWISTSRTQEDNRSSYDIVVDYMLKHGICFCDVTEYSDSGDSPNPLLDLKKSAYSLMTKTNVSSILIEFQPFENEGDSVDPIKVTCEPFGDLKRLALIKRCLSQKDDRGSVNGQEE